MNRASAICIISLLLAGCTAADNQVTSLSPSAFQSSLAEAQIQLLDVRTGKEFQSGHLRNAMQADWTNKTEFKDRTSHLSKEKPVLLYCASGVRSSAAARDLVDRGFRVRMLEGGIKAWKAENKPLEIADNEKPINLAEYKVLTNLGPVVLVDIGADWCPPCKIMEPVIKKLEGEFAGEIKVVRIDAGLQSDLMKAVNAEKIPTFIIYRNGLETWRKEGIVTMEELKRNLR